MQTISFNSTNAFLGLGTISICLIAYFGLVALALLLKILIKLTNGKFVSQNAY